MEDGGWVVEGRGWRVEGGVVQDEKFGVTIFPPKSVEGHRNPVLGAGAP